MPIITPVTVPRTQDHREIRKWREGLATRNGYQTYAGDPTTNIVARWIGDECLDTTNSDWYKSTGVAASTWKKITP